MCVEVAFESSYLYKFNSGWLCSKFFAHSSYLQKHLICHSGEKTYLCSQFPMLFLNSFNLNFLYCNSSLWRKTFSCSQCSKSFALSSKLQIYLRIHSGEKPYICWTCTKTFCRSDNLKTRISSGICLGLAQC
jgi:KRAB domain-containing zinc finger protein